MTEPVLVYQASCTQEHCLTILSELYAYVFFLVQYNTITGNPWPLFGRWLSIITCLAWTVKIHSARVYLIITFRIQKTNQICCATYSSENQDKSGYDFNVDIQSIGSCSEVFESNRKTKYSLNTFFFLRNSVVAYSVSSFSVV